MDEDISIKKIAAIGLLVVLALLLLGWATSWFGLVTQRPMAKYQEETRKEVYDTSRQYQQGTNRDVARYCEQMRTADNPAAKKAVAALIRSTLSTYDGPLTEDNKDCAQEAGAF
jgi:Tfp pilus assembly protein PilO